MMDSDNDDPQDAVNEELEGGDVELEGEDVEEDLDADWADAHGLFGKSLAANSSCPQPYHTRTEPTQFPKLQRTRTRSPTTTSRSGTT